MKYNLATQPTSTTPCTNVPIHCPLCPDTVSGSSRTIWKYNAVFHLASEHSETGALPIDLPAQLMVEMFISKQEEGLMDIGREMTEDYRNAHGLWDSEAHETHKQDLEEQPSQAQTSQSSRRRPRAPSSPPSSSIVHHPPVRVRMSR